MFTSVQYVERDLPASVAVPALAPALLPAAALVPASAATARLGLEVSSAGGGLPLPRCCGRSPSPSPPPLLDLALRLFLRRRLGR